MRLRNLLLSNLVIFLHTSIASSQDEPSETPAADNEGYLSDEERYHNAYGYLQGFTRNLDNLFSNEKYLEEPADARLRLRGGFESSKEDGLSLRQSVNLQMTLPQLSRRFRLFVESLSKDDVSNSGATTIKTDQPIQASGSRVGGRYDLIDKNNFLVYWANGVRFHGGPQFFSEIRARYENALSDNLLWRPTQFLFYRYQNGGIGETTRNDFDYVLDDKYLFRTRTELTRAEDFEGLPFSHELSLFKNIEDVIGLGAKARVDSYTQDSRALTDYLLQLTYRQRIKHSWFILEFSPFVKFQEEHDFSTNPGMLVLAEIQLDRFAGKEHVEPK